MSREGRLATAVLCVLGVACTSREERQARQLETCKVISYSGGQLSNCLVMKYDWIGKDAMYAGIAYDAELVRVRQRVDSMERARSRRRR